MPGQVQEEEMIEMQQSHLSYLAYLAKSEEPAVVAGLTVLMVVLVEEAPQCWM